MGEFDAIKMARAEKAQENRSISMDIILSLYSNKH